MPFDFDAAVRAPFRMQPGLRRLTHGPAPWSPNRLDSAHLAAKLAVLTACPADALITSLGFDPRPALRTVMAEAVRAAPEVFDWDGADAFSARRLGWGLRGGQVVGDGPPAIGDCLSALAPPLRTAGLLSLAFEEDFAGVDADTSTIPWLAVCLPSHWSPASKVGRSFAEVHAPVADAGVLVAAGEHLMRLVTGGERWERFVWSITPRRALDAHPARVRASSWSDDATPDVLAQAAFFRTEHQTFVPVQGPPLQAVFSIRVAVRPLTEAIDTVDRARRLQAALASMSDAVLAYRGLTGARERLLEWLAGRSA